MVWGTFSGKGLGNIVLVEGNLNSTGYISLLGRNLFESAKKMNLKELLFQQDMLHAINQRHH